MPKDRELRAKCAERMARAAGCAPRYSDDEIKDIFLKLVDQIVAAEAHR